MREILFRGKVTGIPLYLQDKTKIGTWVYGSYVSYPVAQIFDLEDEYVVDPATVGQFTGHFSKEKAKVFEGDILKDLSETDPRYKDAIYVIVWDKENARFALNYHDTLGYKNSPRKLIETNGFKDVFKLEEWARIIGNIHDNPELLKEEESK